MSDPFRYELKFILDERRLHQARGWIAAQTQATAGYCPRVVNSVYYDTADMRSLTDNISGIADRIKIRLRWYGDNNHRNFEGICLEIKRRRGRLNNKQRIALPELTDSMGNWVHCEIQQELTRRVSGTGGAEQLPVCLPTLQVQYTREYFDDCSGMRLTLDQRIRFFMTPINAKLYFGAGTRYPWAVMEIKFPPHLKSRVADSMRRLRISPRRHSKYAAGLAAYGLATYF